MGLFRWWEFWPVEPVWSCSSKCLHGAGGFSLVLHHTSLGNARKRQEQPARSQLAGGVIECGWDKQSFSSRICMGGGWSQNGVLPFDNGVLAWHNWYATLDRSRQAWEHFAPASQLAERSLPFPPPIYGEVLKSQVLDAFAQWPSSLRRRRGMCFGASSHWRHCT